MKLKVEESKKASKALTPREQRINFYIKNYAGCSSGNVSTKLDISLSTVKKTIIELLNKKGIEKKALEV